MRILGIDPGLSVTGYGLIEYADSGCSLIETGVIKTRNSDKLPKRLSKIFQGVRGLIEDTHPDILVLEKLYAHYRHPLTSCLLGHARGITCLLAAEHKLGFVEYPSTRIKKALTGKGAASKRQVKKMVEHTLGINVSSGYFDPTDALACAIAHSNIIKAKV